MNISKLRLGLKIGMLCFISTSCLSTLYLTYWLYEHPTYNIVVETKKDNEKVKLEDSSREMDTNDGVEYTNEVELQSTEQIQKAKQDTSKPLFLRNYLSIPDLGINVQIFEGISERVLSQGAGTIKPKQVIDKIGNYAIAAHNMYDFNYGHGFSKLQKYKNVNGKLAYVSDGVYVYTFRLLASETVPREDSMKFTEDDFPQQFYQQDILKWGKDLERVKSNKIYDKDGSYLESDVPQEFAYGKLLTLYTCEVYWANGWESVDRILVTGVQVDKTLLTEAPKNVYDLFYDGEEIGVTEVESPKEVQDTAKLEAKEDDKKEEDAEKIDSELEVTNGDSNFINQFINRKLKENINFVNELFYVSIGTFLILSLVFMMINYLSEHK